MFILVKNYTRSSARIFKNYFLYVCAVLFFFFYDNYVPININISRLVASKIKTVYKCCFVMIFREPMA